MEQNKPELAANHKPKPFTPPQSLNISQLAALTGITQKTIRSRLQQAGMTPVGTDQNGGVLFETRSALKAIYAKSAAGQQQKDDLRCYLKELKAKELEFKLQQQKNKLVPVGEIEPTIRQLFLFIKQTIDSIPSLVIHSLKSELPPEQLPKINSLLEEQTKKINEELAKPLFQVKEAEEEDDE